MRAQDDAYLLHVPTTAVFGVDSLGLSVIGHCREAGGRSVDELVALLADRHPPGRVRAFAAELRKLEVAAALGSLKPINPGSVKVNSYPLSTLVLNVNTGCTCRARIATRKIWRNPRTAKKWIS